MLDTEKTTLLDQPLDMTQIKHRQGGGGRQLAYISGKFAMDQANRIFGYGQWGYKVVNRGQVVIDTPDGNKVTMYTADVELWVTGAQFTFPGAGVGIVTKPYTIDMHEKAYKEAETDAMKRALRHYGDQFGLCLYDGEDYVDAGNGEMVQVKNVPIQGKPQPTKQQQAPRSLPTPVQSASTQTPKPAETQQESKPPTLEERFRAAYKRALALRQFTFKQGATDQEKRQAFLAFAGPIVNATLTSTGQLTASRLDTIEAYLNAKDAA